MRQPNQPNPPKNQQTNANIAALAYLYDNTAFDLVKAITSGQVLLSDEKIKNQVRWLGEIANTLSLVYQVESMRSKPKEDSLGIPAPKVNSIDPALKKSQQTQSGFINPNQPNSMSQFPGNWRP